MIAIIDYGVGNLRSVEKAFQSIGCDAVVTSDLSAAEKADAVVLPGVGAFEAAMGNLVKTGMYKAVEHAISANKPFLGICLGLQLLFEYSEESGSSMNSSNGAECNAGKVMGLGIFKGCISQIPASAGLKIPHMGWNSLDTEPRSVLFRGLEDNPYVYFVHSYCLHAEDRSIVSSRAAYGITFDSSISVGNIHATQFHPEKSGTVGLNILRNFIGLVNER